MNEAKPAGRLVSLDAYRGFVMLAMASEGFRLARVAQGMESGPFWDAVAHHTEHVAWRGCGFWDLIQPSFMFIVGAAMPFSDARRRALGQGWGCRLRHVVVRSFVLVALAIYLSTPSGAKGTHFVFTNVLAQIGLGYTFVFLLMNLPAGGVFAAALAILVGDWALFALRPLPGPDFAPAAVGLGADWKAHWLDGFLGHWNKNANAAAAFDVWFLNLFPRPGGEPFRFNEGGYATLNFVPSIATMLFGVLAGRWLRSGHPGPTKAGALLMAGGLALLAGTALDTTLCPVVKRIWTPAWVLSSTAWTVWLLAAFYWVLDVRGRTRWAFPLVVVGLNSIAMYVMSQQMKPYVRDKLRVHGGTLARFLHDNLNLPVSRTPFAGTFGPIYESAAVLLVFWLVCFWLYRRRIFLKI